MRFFPEIACLLLSWMLPAPSSAQEAVAEETTVPVTTEPAVETTAPTPTPTPTPTTGQEPTPVDQQPTTNDQQPPPGECPLPAAASIEAALIRSDEGAAAADLDLAACWRVLAQPYPERVALARALERGVPDVQAEAVRARLEELGGPPPVTASDVPEDAAAVVPADAAPDGSAGNGDALAAYVLAGLAIGGLVSGTALGLGALYEDSRSERELTDNGRAVELGIAAGVCAGVGLAAGIAALVLWPEEETGPTAGPGEVGLGWEVRF